MHVHDGTVVTARNITALREVSSALETDGRKMGLRLHENKTKNHTYPNPSRMKIKPRTIPKRKLNENKTKNHTHPNAR